MAPQQPESDKTDQTDETIGSVLEKAIVPDLEKMGDIINKSTNLAAITSLGLVGMVGVNAYKSEILYESQRKEWEAMTQQPGTTDEMEHMITSQLQKLDTRQSAARIDDCMDAAYVVIVVAIMLSMRSSIKRIVAGWKTSAKGLKESIDAAHAQLLETAHAAIEKAHAQRPPREVHVLIVTPDDDIPDEADAPNPTNVN